MKRSLFKTAFVITLCLLLAGCDIGFFSYYGTPKDAYLADPYKAYVENVVYDTVNSEIDCIELSDSEALWFAVVNGTYVVETFMEVKDGEYRVGDRSSVYDFTDLDISSAEKLSFDSYPLSSDQTLYWALTLTDLLPELDQAHEYTVKNYSVLLNGEDTDLTLVYYFEEV